MSSRGKKKNPEKIREVETKKVQKNHKSKMLAFDENNKHIQKWVVLVVAILCAILFALPMITVKLNLTETQTNLLGGADTQLSLSAPALIGAAFEGYDDAFEYLMDHIPALVRVQELGQESLVTSIITTKLRAQLNMGYIALAVICWISMISLLFLLTVAILACTKVKVKPLLKDIAVYFASLLSFISFIVIAYVQMQGTKDVSFGIGAGFGISIVIMLGCCGYVIAAACVRRKILNAEKLNGQKM